MTQPSLCDEITVTKISDETTVTKPLVCGQYDCGQLTWLDFEPTTNMHLTFLTQPKRLQASKNIFTDQINELDECDNSGIIDWMDSVLR